MLFIAFPLSFARPFLFPPVSPWFSFPPSTQHLLLFPKEDNTLNLIPGIGFFFSFFFPSSLIRSSHHNFNHSSRYRPSNHLSLAQSAHSLAIIPPLLPSSHSFHKRRMQHAFTFSCSYFFFFFSVVSSRVSTRPALSLFPSFYKGAQRRRRRKGGKWERRTHE